MVFTGCNFYVTMINNNYILTEIQGSTAHIWLNRPSLHNALNSDMITEFLSVLRRLNNDSGIRILVLRAKGSTFCAGADLIWMQQSVSLSAEENLRECKLLAMCFYEIFSSRKITIALVQGTAMGGGVGLISASDMAFAENSVEFALSELRVGLVPAIIAPYIIRKVGYAKSRELMLTGRKFTAAEAEQFGLINKALPAETINNYTMQVINDILYGAPLAQETLKMHLNSLDALYINASSVESGAKLIAETRIATEANEGISAFREKRKPDWCHH